MRWSRYCLLAFPILACSALAADRQAAAQRFLEANPGTGLYELHGRVMRVYGTPSGYGLTAEEAAARWVAQNADVLGADAADLVPVSLLTDGRHTTGVMYDRATDSYKFTLVYFSQFRGGIPVFRADVRLLCRNAAGNPIVLVSNGLRELGDFQPGSPEFPADAVPGAVVAVYPEMLNFSEPVLTIWGGVDFDVVEPRLAWQVEADNGMVFTEEEARRLLLVDAASGAILYDEDMILHTDVTGNVSGLATQGWGADICGPEESEALPWARVQISGGNTAYADADGNFTIPNGGSGQVTVTSGLNGQWFQVLNAAGAETVLSMNVTPPGPANFVHNSANNSELQRAEVNAYLHANVVRDYALLYNPNYPTIANQTNFPANVFVSGTCNAFYNGSSINFYPAGGGCADTAFSVVVHHEYGHHLVATAGSGQGAYGEGMSDCMGVIITDTSVLALGFQNNCSVGIRDADNNCQYQTSGCSSCGSEVHACGMLISGCVWDTRTNLLGTNPDTYREIISNLTVNSILLHSGTSITPSITIDFLTLDDDNGDINDGTPHYAEINGGFSAHNMAGPVIQPLKFEYPNGRPEFVDPAGGDALRVDVSALTGQPQPNTGKLYYRLGTSGSFTSVNMTDLSSNEYTVDFPAAPCGTTIQYYVSAETTGAVEVFNPAGAPASVYSTLAAYGLNNTFTDDFETSQGWTVENVSLTAGAWERAVPNGGGARGDPAADNDPSGAGYCFVTQNGAGDTDVDGGPTRMISPTFNLSSSGSYVISYARWFTNDDNDADRLDVHVSNNNGSTWVLVESVANSNGWIARSFNLNDYVAPSAQVKIRFSATDNPNNSVTEGGIDSFSIQEVDCTPPTLPKGDANCDGSVNGQDISAFSLALSDPTGYGQQYPDCSILQVDMNDDGSVNGQDIEGFVDALTP